MSKREFEDIYIDYLLEQSEDARRRTFAAHLKDCAECKAELAELRETLFSLPLDLPLTEPPSYLREAVMRQTAGPRLVSQASLRQPGWRIWAIAASVLVAALGLVALRQWQTKEDMTRQIGLLQEENRRLRESNSSLSDRVDLLTRPDTRFLRMAGLENFRGTSGSAFLQPADRMAIAFIHNLPSVPQQQDFQMWVIQNGRPPFPSQVFKPSGQTTEISFSVPVEVSQVAVLAVTIEPAGGSPQPTGPMVLAGRFEE